MGRPRRTPEPSAHVVAVRITAEEREVLAMLVELQNAGLNEQGFAAAVTPSTLIRSWIIQRGREAGLLPGPLAREVRGHIQAPKTPDEVTKKEPRTAAERVLDGRHVPDVGAKSKLKRRTR